MQDEGSEALSDGLLEIDDSDFQGTHDGAAPRSIDDKTHLSKCVNAAELIVKTSDLEKELLQVKEKSKYAGTNTTLNKDQL